MSLCLLLWEWFTKSMRRLCLGHSLNAAVSGEIWRLFNSAQQWHKTTQGRKRRHHIKLKLHKAKFRETECNYPAWTLAKTLMLTPLLLKKRKKCHESQENQKERRPCFQSLFWKMAPQVAQCPLALCQGIDSVATKKEGHPLKSMHN